MRCQGLLVNRFVLRGILVFCEPPQNTINRGVRVERKFANSHVNLITLLIGFSLFPDFGYYEIRKNIFLDSAVFHVLLY